MKQVTKIHQNKQPVRRHFLKEWLEARDMDAMDLVDALNEADTSQQPTDKSQIYRWLKGQLPRGATLIRIAAALELTDPETGDPNPEILLRHPEHDWIARHLQDRSRDEIDRLKQMVDLAFPPKTGTHN